MKNKIGCFAWNTGSINDNIRKLLGSLKIEYNNTLSGEIYTASGEKVIAERSGENEYTVYKLDKSDVSEALRKLFESIGMHDHAAEVDEFIADKEDLPEQVEYLQRLRNDAKCAKETTTRADRAEFARREKVLIEILEIIYLYLL